jgi:hypothetical protein
MTAELRLRFDVLFLYAAFVVIGAILIGAFD